jgi:hypothetical protein
MCGGRDAGGTQASKPFAMNSEEETMLLDEMLVVSAAKKGIG